MTLKVFMVMPFMNDVAHTNYEHSIKPICETLNLELRRGDEIFSNSIIHTDIVKEIQDASIIIVDITGRNPNVFYELGMAHTLKSNRTIMITQDSFKETPFDIAHFRTIPYENSIVGKVKFEKQLISTLQNLLSDYKETFKEEFELVSKIFLAADEESGFIALIGLSSYTGLLSISEWLKVEGEGFDLGARKMEGNAESLFEPFEIIEYVSFSNEIISLTEKGKAFVEILSKKGVKCTEFLTIVDPKDRFGYSSHEIAE